MITAEWDGREYDLDPLGMTVGELDLLGQRTGESWGVLLSSAARLNPMSIKALFWINDYRRDPSVAYGSYQGPPLGVVLPHIAALKAVWDEVGKVLEGAGLVETPSRSEPSGSDGDPETSTS